jgi:hypothetical protein
LFITSATAVRASAVAVASLLFATLSGPSLAAGLRGPIPAAARTAKNPGPAASGYSFVTLDDPTEITFNQLLGINDAGVISGYYGSGNPGDPNVGYTVAKPYSAFVVEDYPGAAQTQVVAINDNRATAGFYVDASGTNHGFIKANGAFKTFDDPNTGAGTVNQLLGLNDSGTAVGFYVDANGLNHGYTLDSATGAFTEIHPPRGSNTIITGINVNGDIVGFTTLPNGKTVGYFKGEGKVIEFSCPGATATTPFGINAYDEVVGSYVDAAGLTHGFAITAALSGNAHFASIDDPNGVGSTVVNGVNKSGTLVGFYTDANGNTDGFIAKP